ncbi:ABC transporter ATP-binding protein [Paraperlucidibaca wandonensis]|jgi:ABC-2 type transport system ATP-binding protein|uniref:ABC transporter ATP-binding protein n=1 Tax=Paraperlucidibaca wandonensis TaxID=1268273 RepID=A0ABW3HDL8_9GAMM|nr:ABC transporter ATP-binding protein [Paraperlucidibaca sp.]MBQ0722280.1 ABC transporter ATP-binding protein [Paraperlucidibaca sp.]MBQ0841887.1 ABC transporter ATP-binding protein [Paraperlucidibaca sp.]|tara:strand:+ start:3229 stop:4170 length:942 start_codon:yes stop_codon:yes gene_type:complete
MTAALQLNSVVKTYKSGACALKGIDLSVAPGDFFAMLGPNGAGKSTCIGIISSLVKKTSGQVSVFGHNIDTDLNAAKRYLGVVPQEFNFGQFEQVIDILATQAGYYGLPRTKAYDQAEKYLEQLGLWEKRNQQARTLSGGMKRRLMVARALVHEPKLLILDEPTAGVDIELRRSMWEYLTRLNEQGTTIILTTHYLEEAESLCRNIAILDKGTVVENTDMRSLLAKLQQETFVLDTVEPVLALPTLDDYQLRKTSERAIEVDIRRGQSLNQVFAALSAQGLQVSSMRNKSNRLEELFVRLVEKNLGPDHGSAA